MFNGKTMKHQHPITFISRLSQASQLNWTALTKEIYTINMGAKKLSFYLADFTVVLRSDHPPLKRFLQMTVLNAKIKKWSVKLSDFNIEFKFIKSVTIKLVDALSRLISLVLAEPDTPV